MSVPQIVGQVLFRLGALPLSVARETRVLRVAAPVTLSVSVPSAGIDRGLWISCGAFEVIGLSAWRPLRHASSRLMQQSYHRHHHFPRRHQQRDHHRRRNPHHRSNVVGRTSAVSGLPRDACPPCSRVPDRVRIAIGLERPYRAWRLVSRRHRRQTDRHELLAIGTRLRGSRYRRTHARGGRLCRLGLWSQHSSGVRNEGQVLNGMEPPPAFPSAVVHRLSGR